MKRLLVAVILLVLSGAFIVASTARADTDSLWVNQQNLKIDMGEPAVNTAKIAGQPCFQTTFKIKRFVSGGTRNGQTIWKKAADDKREVCAVQTGVGLVGYVSGGTYIRFPGSEYATRIHSNSKSLIIIVIPVPGSSTVIIQTKTSTSYSPFATHIFYNLLGVGEITISGGEEIYYLKHWPERFRDQNGDTLDISNITLSNNGEWIVAKVRGAIMRVNIRSKDMQTISRAFDGGVQYHTAITNDGRYAFVQPYHLGSSEPIIYDLQSCEPSWEYRFGFTPQVSPGCGKREIKSSLQKAIPGFLLLEQPEFGYDGQTLRGLVSYRQNRGAPIFKNRLVISREDYTKPVLDYLALGDSFSSGEGDTLGGTWYEPGTDTDNNKCHVSRRSYPYLVAEQLGLHDGPNKTPEEGSMFHSIACSGAISEDILRQDKNYQGQVNDRITKDNRNQAIIFNNFKPGFLGQIEFVNHYSPKTVTVSIIGNDIGFKDKLVRCLGPDTCFNTYESRLEILNEIQSKFDTLAGLYNSLKTASPSTSIYALGYPQLIYPEGSCGVNVRLNKTEAQMANDMVRYLNALIKAAAQKAGVNYIDVQNAFSGKRLCEGPNNQLAVNGLTAGDDVLLELVGNESYHPNPIGQTRLAQRVAGQSDALTLPNPLPDLSATPPKPDAPEFMGFYESYPKENRPIYHTMNGDEAVDDVIVPLLEQESSFEAPVPGKYSAWLNSQPIFLGEFETDENNMLNLKFTVPGNIPVGIHSFHLYGKSLDGGGIDISKTVFVAASAEDYDADGTVNGLDSCPTLPPSGFDQDNDGIDDACDRQIGTLELDSEVSGDLTNPKPSPNNPETVAGNEHQPSVSATSEPISQPTVILANNATSSSDDRQIVGTTPQDSPGQPEVLSSSSESVANHIASDNPDNQAGTTKASAQQSKGYIWVFVVLGVLLLASGLLVLRRITRPGPD